ncbi:MAG: hypothetical protein H7Y89_13220, partial [Steroidobacteraceae bacterium]|nr:hypothetical protein [Steroidobacteraceae bacterium]
MIGSESAERGRFLAQLAAFIALAVGSLAFAGWLFDIDSLTNIAPQWPRMSKLTALGFVLAGVTLWLASSNLRQATSICAMLVAAIGATIMLRNFGGWDIHLEQLSTGPLPHATDGIGAVRMSPATAFSLTLLGLSLWCSTRRGLALLHQGLAIAVLLVGWLGLSRYVLGADQVFAFANMALHTAMLLCLLAVGALTLRPEAGVAELLASNFIGGA